MAYPIILVDSATGSDTAASGAGPATALTGMVSGSTDATGLIVTVLAGTDLTNVAVDGSHVIYLGDTTAGARNFGKITAKAGSGGATPNVTVSDAFGINQAAKPWAIGGKRATLFGGTSLKLVDNNSAAGDAMPGWTMRFSSGHAESTGLVTLRRNGDVTNGRITIDAVDGYAVRPVITFTNAGNSFDMQNLEKWRLCCFKMKPTNAAPGNAFSSLYNTVYFVFEDLIIGDSTYYYRGASGGNNNGMGVAFIKCLFDKNSSGHFSIGAGGASFFNCRFMRAGATAVEATQDVQSSGSFVNCVFADSTGYGYRDTRTGYNAPILFTNCTFDNNTLGGMYYNANHDGLSPTVLNCIFSNNSGYGYNSGTGTVQSALAYGQKLINCCFYNNTSGKYPTGFDAISTGEVVANPTYVGGGDYTPTNTALQMAMDIP